MRHRHTALLIVLLLAAFQWGAVSVVQAGPVAPPPPPPTPTSCGPCGGPPPPPTPVKTLPSTLVPAAVYKVDLAPKHVKRGHKMKVVVTAGTSDGVMISVRYHKAKPVIYKGKVGASNTYTKSWTVSKTAPLGKGSATVTIVSADKFSPSPDPFVIQFTVTK